MTYFETQPPMDDEDPAAVDAMPGADGQPMAPGAALVPQAAGALANPAGDAAPPVIDVRELTKTYVLGSTRVRALRGISLAIRDETE